MTNSRLRDGFTFIEVVIALAVIAIALTSIFALQQASMQSTYDATNKLRRILLLKNVLYDPAIVRDKHDKELESEKKIKEPATTIIIKREKVTSERLKNYELERITAKASWFAFWGTQDESLVIFRFKLPKKEGQQ